MSEQPAVTRAIKIWPPDTITAQPFKLDDLVFSPTDDRRFEHATRDDVLIGAVLLDTNKNGERVWLARKLIADEMSDWKPMRCVHEARAFIVSRTRTQ